VNISRKSVPILLTGTTKFQAGWLILGLTFWGGYFHQNPGTAPFEVGDGSVRSIWALTALGFMFIAGGIAAGRQRAQFLRNGRLVSGRALKIEEDRSGEDIEYRYVFEYLDENGRAQVIRLVRHRCDISVAQTVSMMIDEAGKEAVVEADLAGGLKFSNLSGAEPLPLLPLLRVGVIPLLSFVPLLMLQPYIAACAKQAVASGYAVVITLPLFGQIFWLFGNNRYFVVSVTELSPSCAQSCKSGT
jgi:hypothetical protein